MEQIFRNEFEGWLEIAFRNPVPQSVKAFAFNLFEPARVRPEHPRFGVELIGSSEFDVEDSDWACTETFVAKPRNLLIPLSVSGDHWQSCLDIIIEVVTEVLETESYAARTLQAAQGIGVGFVDGDMHIVRHK